MSFSEIRHSQIAELLSKVQQLKYGKYLRSVRIVKSRGLSGAEVRFDFPVTALIGPNGGGKSTVLGAAACAYKEIKPGMFFPKSSIGDNSMSNWSIEYEIIDRTVNRTANIRRSSNFRRARWARGEVLSRPVAYFGINRTVPAGENPSFKRLMGGSYQHTAPLSALPPLAVTEIERILGKPIQDFRQTMVGENQSFYTGRNSGNDYSEFHFGAGESSIIRIINAIESLPDNAFVLVEEIENGLHPIATRRLVEYLIAAAERKKLQAIFTTHSDEALSPLPAEAIWACLDSRIQQGKLSVNVVRAISGKIDTRLAIFVEDEFAKHWVEAILRTCLPETHDQVEVHAVAGDGVAVSIHRAHQENPAIQSESLCFIDGDSEQSDDPESGIHRLPGRQPELTVFDSIAAGLKNNVAILTVACQLGPDKQDQVRQTVSTTRLTNRDPHVLFSQVGIALGFVPEVIIRGAFLSQWIRDNLEALQPLISAVRTAIAASD